MTFTALKEKYNLPASVKDISGEIRRTYQFPFKKDVTVIERPIATWIVEGYTLVINANQEIYRFNTEPEQLIIETYSTTNLSQYLPKRDA